MTLRRRLLIIGVLILLVLATVGFLLFPLFSDSGLLGSEHLKNLALSQIERNTGRKVEIGHVRLKFFPRIRLELSNVVVRDLDPSRVFLKAPTADLTLRLLPLLRRQFIAKRMMFESPEITVRRNARGEWNILGSPGSPPGESEQPGNTLRNLFLISELTISNGRITVVDESRPGDPRSLEIKSLDLAIVAEPARGLANLHLAAIIPGSPGVSSVSFAGSATQTETQVGITQGNIQRSMPAFQFDGSVEASNLHIDRMVAFFGDEPGTDWATGSVNLRSRIRVIPGVVGYDMVMSDLAAENNHFALNGQASLSGLLTAQPTLALTFSSSQLPVSELVKAVPIHKVLPQLPTMIAEHDIQGNLEVSTATITGVVTPDPHLSLTGEFRINQGHAFLDAEGTAVENVSGTIFVEPDRIRVVELNGMYGKMRVDAGKAIVSLLKEGPRLDLALNGEMTAADLIAEVDPSKTFPPKPLAKAWKGLQDIQGTIIVAFRMSGPLKQPDEIKFIDAEFEIQDVGFHSPLLPERVRGLSGRLAITEKGMEFNTVNAWMGQTLFQFEGGITPDTKKAYRDFTISARAPAVDLGRFLPAGIVSGLPLKGSVKAVVALSGPLTSPRLKGTLDLIDAGITIPGFFRKPRGRQASFEFDGALSKQAIPFLHRLELVLPTQRLTGRGTIQLDKNFRINSTVGVGPVAVTQLPDWIRPEGMEQGDLEVSLNIRGTGKNWTTWRITGWIAVTNGVFSITGIDSPVRDVDLRLKLIRDRAELKQLAFRILDSDAQISGVIRNWQQKPALVLTAESSHFDLDLLIPKGQQSSLREFFKELAASTKVTTQVTLKRGTYKLLTLTDLSGRVNITKGVLDLDRINGKSLSGQVNGRVVVRLPKQGPASTEVVVRIAGLPFEEFHSLFTLSDPPVEGDLFLTGSLRSNGSGPRGVSSGLQGESKIRIDKGRIFKDDSRVVWKILSLLNLPALLQGKVDLDKDGLPFDQITSTMIIEKGLVSSDNIMVDSPVVKMTAAGHYDIPTDQLDYIVAVSPFGPYSSFLKNIPLFGKLLKGERKGLATSLFEVKGSLQNPQVRALPVQSFVSGLGGVAKLAVDLLFNIVTLPKEILDPSEEKKPDLDSVPEITNPPSP